MYQPPLLDCSLCYEHQQRQPFADSSVQKINKNFANRNSDVLKHRSYVSYYSISISAVLSTTNSNSHNSAEHFAGSNLSCSTHYYRYSYKWYSSKLNWPLMLDFHRANCQQRWWIFTAIGHPRRGRQRYNSNACFICNDDLADCCCCSIESWRTQRCAAGVRSGCLFVLILITDDASRLDCRLVFEAPGDQAYHYRFIQF